MTVLVTSDWHLNGKLRDRYRHDWVRDELPQLIVKHKVYDILMLGDLTDDFDNHPASLVNDIIDLLVAATAPSDNIPWQRRLYLMRGNHDYVDPTTPFFKFTKRVPGITWINSPCVYELDDIGSALFLPHTRDYKEDWKRFGNDFKRADICFAHNTFDGTISESGAQLSGIPPSVFPSDLMVISGDIHKRQDVGNITYVGSPYTVDFGDDFKPRVLLLADGKVKSIACSGPQKRLIAPKDDGDLRRALKEAGASGDIVKLRITVGKSEQENWGTIKRLIAEEALNMGVRLHSIEPVMPEAIKAASKYRAKAGKPKRDDEVVKEYCKTTGVEDSLTQAGLAIVHAKE